WVRYIDEKGDTEEGHTKAREIYRKAAQLGLTRLGYPPEYGGIEVDPLTIGLVAETLGRYGGLPKLESGAALYGATGSAMVLARSGSEELKKEWLPKIIEGDRTIAIGTTEPHCGSDAAQIKTTAVREGEEYVINGEKQMVGGTRWADAFISYCRTSEERYGITALLVENNRQGISKYHFKTLGGSFWELGGVVYKDVRVPASNRIGPEDKGFGLAMGLFDWMRALSGAQCIGMAQGALDESIEYVKQRSAFGQPIGKWEAVQFRISEAATMLEAARWLTYRTLWLAGKGMSHSKESSMVKWWVPTVTFNIINDCIQNKGATGYTTENLDELKLRWIRALWIADGTIDIQKIVIGREILGKEFVPYRK
ncbi:MAG: acyl-CoA dehydrogenase family protein, partial [Thaumarchaeota archaeon]|nr:acyl-CoA dehydrogenase family protein [Nitrososphaerota archaeon]